MRIISYLDYENSNLSKKKQKSFFKNDFDDLDLDILAPNLNLNLASKYADSNTAGKYKMRRNNFSFKKATSIFSLTALALSLCMVLLIFIFSSLSNTSLKKFSFAKSVDSKLSMQAYLFPQKKESQSKKGSLTSISDLLREVEFKNYSVQSGDTLSAIAHKFGLRSIGTLIAVNGISNVKRLQVGESLKVPSIDGLFHTVKKNESVESIAKKYGTSVNNILDANDLKSEIINVGNKLFIPGAALSSSDLKKAMGELFIYPIYGRFTSYFGYRRDPFTGLKSFHNGLDIANKKGTLVKCIMDGRVSEIAYSRIYGNYIIVVHDSGYQSLYGHLDSVYVKRGQYVSQGTKIAGVGSTGRSTGPHLHLSIYKNGKVIDPLTVLDK